MKRFKFTDIFIGILFTLLFISVAVIITINFRPLYYMDINYLNIEASSGMEKAEIIKNYDALIDYCSPFFTGNLSFPSLEASVSGLQHFAEVKNIFTGFYLVGALTLILGVAIIIRKARNRDFYYLLVSAITAIVLPVLLGIYIAVDFDRAFLLFHQLCFKNDYWIFDPVTDPVILMLPEAFFMHCAILIISIVLLLCTAFVGIFFWKKSHFSIKNRKSRGLRL
ncbi:MAG TPA: TIGR01906 family membrane protein [Clostridiales bacterium]|nr:TIGR01906 family membrane protein [Clostridiales bacterium]